MNKLISSKPLIFLLIFIPSVIYLASLIGRLYPISMKQEPLFLFDLLGIHQNIPAAVIYLLGGVNLLLIYFLSRKLFKGWAAYLPPLIFSLSPWSAYLIYADSNYIYLLSLVLIIFIGLLLVRSGSYIPGVILFVAGCILGIYSSLIIFLILLPSVVVLICTRFVAFKLIKLPIFFITFFNLLLIFLIINNPIAIRNIYDKEFMIFSDVGLMNATNNYQGESQNRKFYTISKLTENKYLYFSKYFIYKVLKNIIPSTFFTPEEHLLRFSFTAPIFVGFLIPFSYGIFLIFKSKFHRKFLLISLVLIIPSVLSKPLVDLSKLVLFEPVVVFVSSFGFIHLIQKSFRNTISKMLLFLCILLVIIQLFVTIFDINLREYLRYSRHFGDKLEIEKL